MKLQKANITVTTSTRTHLREREFNALMLHSYPVAFREPPHADTVILPELPEGLTAEEAEVLEELTRLFSDCMEERGESGYPQLVGDEDDRCEGCEPEPIDDEESVTLSFIGNLTVRDGVLSIMYTESDFNSRGSAETVISFEDPDLVTMSRSGAWQTELIFSADCERRLCDYPAPMPLEVSVSTESFKNTVTYEKGGVIDVIYHIEMKGVPVESCHITVNVKVLA